MGLTKKEIWSVINHLEDRKTTMEENRRYEAVDDCGQIEELSGLIGALEKAYEETN